MIRTLRAQAWERAKGEMQAMLATFWPEARRAGQFEELDKMIAEFVENVENNALHE